MSQTLTVLRLHGKVNLFPRHRHFGKSLNMSMLKCFFEVGTAPALFEGLKIMQELTYRDIDDSVENVWSVLYATGYLTGKHVEQVDADIFSLWISNGEIHKLFSDLVQDWFKEMIRSDSARINRFCAVFPTGDAEIGIEIELKYADNGNLEAACAEALKQIEDRKYAEGLKRWGVKKVTCF